MQNLILSHFESTTEKPIILHLGNYDYLRVVSGKLIKIDRSYQSMIGRKFKLQYRDSFGYYYLYACIDEYGFFTSRI